MYIKTPQSNEKTRRLYPQQRLRVNKPADKDVRLRATSERRVSTPLALRASTPPAPRPIMMLTRQDLLCLDFDR